MRHFLSAEKRDVHAMRHPRQSLGSPQAEMNLGISRFMFPVLLQGSV